MVDILNELEEILKANALISFVGNGVATVPLASETNDTAVYIQCPNLVPMITRTSTKQDGYDYHMFCNLIVNVDCHTNRLRVYDIVDSIQLSLLNDSQIWVKATDRNIITAEFDSSEFYPYRSAIISLEVVYRVVL